MAFLQHLDVMVVDDTSVSRGLLCNSLEEIGIPTPRVEKNGKLALHRLMTKPAHLVISDYNMPEMNGLELLRVLREFPATRTIGFILVTGNADRSLIEEGRKWGLNNYLKKPFNTPTLKACVQAVIGKWA